MNATDRFMAVLLNHLDGPAFRDDYTRHGNQLAHVRRDLPCTAQISYYRLILARTSLPSRPAGNWVRRVGSRSIRAYHRPQDPVKPVVRFLRLQRMLDAQ